MGVVSAVLLLAAMPLVIGMFGSVDAVIGADAQGTAPAESQETPLPSPSPSPSPSVSLATVVVVKDPPDEEAMIDVTYTDADGAPAFVFGAPSDAVVVADFEVEPGIGEASIDLDPAWRVADAGCDDATTGDTPSVIGPELLSASFGIDPGEHVTCTFRVERVATFDVVIATVPADAVSGRFELTYEDRGLPRMIEFEGRAASGRGYQSLTGVHPLALSVDAGWVTDQVGCEDEVGGASVGDAASSSATLDLEPGEHVTCTFTVHRFGNLSVAVVTDSPGAEVSLPVTVTSVLTTPVQTSVDYPTRVVAAGETWDLGPVPPNGAYVATVPDPPAPWKIRDAGCVGAENTGGGEQSGGSGWLAVAAMRASDQVVCTFRLSDRIIPKPGPWYGVAKNHQACPVGAETESSNFTLAVQRGGARLIAKVGKVSIVVDAINKKNVYRGRYRGFEYTWTVKSEERITGTARFLRGGCVSSSFTYTYRGS